MSTTPNTSPIFIRSIGIIGQPVALTNQICSRDNPGNNPIIIYSPTASYALGNGALVEAFQISATGTTNASCLLIFCRINDEAQPIWRKIFEVSLPAVSSVGDAAIANYPVEVLLPNILSPIPSSGPWGQLRGLRLNPYDRPVEWGVGLTTAVGSFPVIVTMFGGEY